MCSSRKGEIMSKEININYKLTINDDELYNVILDFFGVNTDEELVGAYKSMLKRSISQIKEFDIRDIQVKISDVKKENNVAELLN